MNHFDTGAQEALHRAAMRVQGAPEGERNETVNKEAYGVAGFVADGRLDRAHVESVLVDAALAAGLDIKEARSTIKSGLNAGIRTACAVMTERTALVREVTGFPVTRRVPRIVIITRWRNKTSPRGGVEATLTLAELVEVFASPVKLSNADASAKGELAMWSAGEFEDGYRHNRAVKLVHLLLLDIDHGNLSADDLKSMLSPVSFLAHTSFSHTPESQRWRVAILTSRPMTPEEYKNVWSNTVRRLRGVDTKACDPARGFFGPAERPGHEYQFIDGTSDLVLDVDANLANPDTGTAEVSKGTSRQQTIKIGRLIDLCGSDWLTRTPEPRLVLLRDGRAVDGQPAELLPLGKAAMLAGPGGACKTTLVISLAVAVVTGRRWLNRFEVNGPGDVLLVVGEEDISEIMRRLQVLMLHMGLSEEEREQVNRHIHVVPAYGCDVRFSDSNRPTSLLSILPQYMVDSGAVFKLIVGDPASRIMGAMAEVDAASATRFVEDLERLTQAPGKPAVLVTHHVSKSAMRTYDADQGAPRGSSALVDGVRTLVLVDRVNLHKRGFSGQDDYLRLTVAKSNYTAPFSAPFWVRISRHGVLSGLDERASRLIESTVTQDRSRSAPGGGSGRDDEFAGLS